MPIVTRKEFAAMCGESVNVLNVNIGRNKIVFKDPETRKHIDPTHPINKAYLEKRLAAKYLEAHTLEANSNDLDNLGTDIDNQDDELPEAYTLQAINNMLLLAGEGSNPNSLEEGPAEWIKQKMKGDAELITVRVQRERLQVETMSSKLIPVELAEAVNKLMAKGFEENFRNGIENIANIFCNIFDITDENRYNQIRNDLNKALDQSLGHTSRQMESDFDNLLTAFSGSQSSKKRNQAKGK